MTKLCTFIHTTLMRTVHEKAEEVKQKSTTAPSRLRHARQASRDLNIMTPSPPPLHTCRPRVRSSPRPPKTRCVLCDSCFSVSWSKNGCFYALVSFIFGAVVKKINYRTRGFFTFCVHPFSFFCHLFLSFSFLYSK